MISSRQYEKRRTLASQACHYITIQRNTATTDGEGGFEGTWSDLMSIFAAIQPIQARQVFQYRSIGVEASHLVRIRGNISVAETDRIQFGTRYFEILAIENIDERNFEQVLTVREWRPSRVE